MKVQSTGLGKTVMVARFKELCKTEFEDRQVLQLTMAATEPLHWTIKVYMEPDDLRKAIGMGLRPSVLLKSLLAIVFGRFSFFKSSESDLEKSSGKAKTRAVELSDASAFPDTNESPSPLAGLKGSADNSETPNPLAKLKG